MNTYADYFFWVIFEFEDDFFWGFFLGAADQKTVKVWKKAQHTFVNLKYVSINKSIITLYNETLYKI